MLFLLATILILPGTAGADFYKWEDASGNIYITDYPPPAQSGKNMQVHKYGSAIQREEERGALPDTRKGESDIVLYTKNSCSECDKAREFLKSRNITFTEYNTDADKEAAKKRKALDDSDQAPFAIINKNQIYGFSENIYSKILKIKP